MNDVDLGGVNGPFAVKAHTSAHLRIAATGFVVANCQRNAVNDGDTGGAGGGDALRFSIVVIEKLLASQFLCANISSKIGQPEDQATHARGTFGDLFGVQDGIG